jgi:alpha-L-rhamnosidase
MLPDGSINPGEMTSFNHYALGAVADWLHRTVGGIAPAEPGYRQINMQPRPGGGLTQASARHRTPYGMAECVWKIEDGNIEVKVVVPPNATAVVTLPGTDADPVHVQSGTYSWSYEYHDPDPRQPLSIDHPISEILDDPVAWTAVTETLTRLAPRNVFIMNMLRTQSKRSLRHVLATLPNADEALIAIADVLAKLE